MIADLIGQLTEVLGEEGAKTALLFAAMFVASIPYFLIFFFSFGFHRIPKLRRCRKRFKKLSRDFAAAYARAIALEPTRFADLPVMPLWTPYDSNTETTVTSTAIPASDVDAFLDAFVAEFYETTGGDVALTRGDNHKAATGKTRVVLAVKAASKKGELAVVALTARAVGKVANVSVRWSCWPESIWPGQAGKTPLCFHFFQGMRVRDKSGKIDYEATWKGCFFEPRAWVETYGLADGGYRVVAEFRKETEQEAQELARIATAVLAQMS